MSEFAIMEKLVEIKSLLEHRVGDRWISMREASRYVGLSEATLRRAIQSGRLKASKRTGKVLFKISWLDRFLD